MDNSVSPAQRTPRQVGFSRFLAVVAVMAILIIAAFTLSFINTQNTVSTVTNTISETTTMGVGSTTTVTQVEISSSTFFGTTQENYPGTTTQMLTIPCPAFSTSTSTFTASANTVPNFSTLFGNFSQITFLFSSNSPIANFITGSFVVLNRTSLGSQEVYAVNVTINAVAAISNTSLAQPQNRTIAIESMLASVSSNGTVISANNETGYSAANLYTQDMNYFTPLLLNSPSFPPDHSVVINTTTIMIGTTFMNVTNYLVPSIISILSMPACDGSTTSEITESLQNRTMQVGVVPGTSFTLLTLYVLAGNSTYYNGGSSEFSEQFEVISFTKG